MKTNLIFLSDAMTLEEYRAIQSKQRKPSTYPESESQMAVIEWCRYKGYPYDRIYAIENERKATPKQAARRKAMGVRSGCCDLFLPIAKNGYHGLFIEMKSKKGKVSEAQQKFINEVRSEGFSAFVCYSADEAIKTLQEYCE